MKIKANGRLAHHFHGNYWATIVIGTDSPKDSALIASQLGEGWSTSLRDKRALVWTGNSEELDACETILESLGADRKKISSIAKSIDYGEEFTITVDVTPPEQLSLL